MNHPPKKLLASVALSLGTLLSCSAAAAEIPKPARGSSSATKAATAAKAPAPKLPYRCRVGNGKGAHYVDSAYQCAPKRPAATQAQTPAQTQTAAQAQAGRGGAPSSSSGWGAPPR